MVTIGDNPADVRHGDSKPAAMQHVRVEAPDMGLKMALITDEVREKFKLIPAQTGVVVTDVVPDSAAADHGIVAGEVIVKVQHNAVTSPSEVSEALQTARQQKHDHLLFLVKGVDGLRWVLPVN